MLSEDASQAEDSGEDRKKRRPKICRIYNEDIVEERQYTMAELMSMFDATEKNIGHWIAYHGLEHTTAYTAPTDSVVRGKRVRKRIVVLGTSLLKFGAEHPTILQCHSEYSRLAEEVRAGIIARARDLIANPQNNIRFRSDVYKRITAETHLRSHTVRHVLKSHDSTHSDEAVFPLLPPNTIAELEEAKWAERSVKEVAERLSVPLSQVRLAITAHRVKLIRHMKLDHMASEEFSAQNAEKKIMREKVIVENHECPDYLQNHPTIFLRDMGRDEKIVILTKNQEQALFRQYNYCKYSASMLRESLHQGKCTWKVLEKIEKLHEKANTIKNQLMRSNLRLVVSCAKHFVTKKHSLEERYSDGVQSLKKAIDRFDYTLGNKFSTYAKQAIMKNFRKDISKAEHKKSKYQAGDPEKKLANVEYTGDQNPERREANQPKMQILMEKSLEKLDEQYAKILRMRFGIGEWEDNPMTLRQIGINLKRSREGVRQIEARALTELREVLLHAENQEEVDDIVGDIN